MNVAEVGEKQVARPRVLYADSGAEGRAAFAHALEDAFEVTCVRGLEEGLAALGHQSFDVLVADVSVRELTHLARLSYPDVPRILVASEGDSSVLPAAASHGHALASVPKPWDAAHLRSVVRHASTLRQLEVDNRRLASELRAATARLQDDVEVAARSVTGSRGTLLVTSPSMRTVLAQVDAVAGTDASVLLHGETGTGKELVAAEIHERSGRRRARFVAQNLAALPPELMTSELFGHVKGAFTGAQQARRGLFELADGGTLFLDEIGEAPPSLQALLLRALESREFWPVGASDPRRVDVRIVAATNRDLLALAHAGQFRLDLYYRLAVCPIEVPPLRARREDVRGIGAPLLEAAARRMNRALPRLTEEAWRALEEHPWPGNVRELGNVMERLVIYHPGRPVSADDLALPRSVRPSLFPPPPASSGSFELTRSRIPTGLIPALDEGEAPPASQSRFDPGSATPGPILLDLPEGGTTFDDLEREILAQILARSDNNQSRAARTLGMSESSFRSRLKRLGLKG